MSSSHSTPGPARPGARTLLILLAAVVGLGAALASTAAAATSPVKPAQPAKPHVVSTAPRGVVAGDSAVRIVFSEPMAPLTSASTPRITPATPGHWAQPTPTTLEFVPTGAYLPGTAVTVTVRRGLAATDGARLAHTVTVTYTARDGSPVRLEQLLAQLRYLPVHLVTHGGPRDRDAAAQQRAIYAPPKGAFRWGHGWPGALHELWVHDNAVVMQGAIMAFESQHGLPLSGTASPEVWQALLAARAHNQFNNAGYTYAVASESAPESLTVYHDGEVVLQTPANTGIPDAPTALGTYPVYERLRSQTMQGTNPDGSHYADFVQWVAYFNGGDAVHYMPRADYGSPQSLGCVELPYAAAERAWGFLSYGSLVSVVG